MGQMPGLGILVQASDFDRHQANNTLPCSLVVVDIATGGHRQACQNTLRKVRWTEIFALFIVLSHTYGLRKFVIDVLHWTAVDKLALVQWTNYQNNVFEYHAGIHCRYLFPILWYQWCDLSFIKLLQQDYIIWWVFADGISMNSKTSDCKCSMTISLLSNDTALQGVVVCTYAFIKINYKPQPGGIDFYFSLFGSVHRMETPYIMSLLQAAISGIAI